eukprot:16441309-Heterocapsa_arctica.AAC.1
MFKAFKARSNVTSKLQSEKLMTEITNFRDEINKFKPIRVRVSCQVQNILSRCCTRSCGRQGSGAVLCPGCREQGREGIACHQGRAQGGRASSRATRSSTRSPEPCGACQCQGCFWHGNRRLVISSKGRLRRGQIHPDPCASTAGSQVSSADPSIADQVLQMSASVPPANGFPGNGSLLSSGLALSPVHSVL